MSTTTLARCLPEQPQELPQPQLWLPGALWLRVLSQTGPSDVRAFAGSSRACALLVRSLGRDLAARVAARQLLAAVPPGAQRVPPGALPRSLRVKSPLCLEYRWACLTERATRAAAAWQRELSVGVVFAVPDARDRHVPSRLGGWSAEAVDWGRALGLPRARPKDPAAPPPALLATPGPLWGLPQGTPATLRGDDDQADALREVALRCDALAFFGEPRDAEWLLLPHARRAGVLTDADTADLHGGWKAFAGQHAEAAARVAALGRVLEQRAGLGLPVACASCAGAEWTVDSGQALSAFVPSVDRAGTPSPRCLRLAIREAVHMGVWTALHAERLQLGRCGGSCTPGEPDCPDADAAAGPRDYGCSRVTAGRHRRSCAVM
eukprot:m51a1_g8532 hypothetical protein (379) ;mRNA; r:156544-158110